MQTSGALYGKQPKEASQMVKRFEDISYGMAQRADGHYVLHEDYAALAERCERLESRAETADWRVNDLREICKRALKEILDSAEARNYSPAADTELIAILEYQISKESQ
jgi:phosphoenolpyruvate-protein kinase (PTS system EI component)